MKSVVFLRTNHAEAELPVVEMYGDGDELTIVLPHRVGISLYREGTKIEMECDLGMTSSSVDWRKIGVFDIAQADYRSAVVLDDKFMAEARSFENHFHVEKFIRLREEYLKFGRILSTNEVFGRGLQDQVYIHLNANHLTKFVPENQTNMEFRIIRNDFMDDELLKEPAFTLLGTIQLRGEVSHHFVFIEWWGNRMWSYGKDFFYNNTFFPIALEEFKRLSGAVAVA